MALRDGFRIPNASTFAPDFQTSQPDQGDFLILGNGRYGVISDCQVSLVGTTASVGAGPHLLVVDGQIYAMTGSQSVSVAPSGIDPRFDLIVYDTSQSSPFCVVAGTPSANPVFPDINSTMTVLAAVFIPASTGSGNLHIIDKRNILQTNVVGVDVPTILKNYSSDGVGVKVNISGNGTISWGSGTGATDTSISRSGVGQVTVQNELIADTLTAVNAATVDGEAVVTTETIAWGTGAERDATTPDIGDVWVNNTNGDVSVFRSTPSGNSWTSLQPNLPAGSVISSFLTPDQMTGWLPLTGGDYAVEEAGNLPGLFPSWVDSGRLYLPDMRGRFPIGAGAFEGFSGLVNAEHGSRVDDIGTVSVGISVSNLPAHRHRDAAATTTGSGGNHSHSGSTSNAGGHSHSAGSAGDHSHGAYDSGHLHDWQAGWPIVATLGHHDSCMDIPFSDASHNHRTIPAQYSNVGYAQIVVQSAGSHSHSISSVGDHSHNIAATSTHAGHSHPLPEHQSVGGGENLSFRPPSLSLYFYIKM